MVVIIVAPQEVEAPVAAQGHLVVEEEEEVGDLVAMDEVGAIPAV